jgi:hypothetical protein
MTTEKKPNDLATIDDLEGIASKIRSEVVDIITAGGMLRDDDPSNNAAAVLEIVQSVSVIGATLSVVAASTVYVLQSLGVM